MAGRRVSPWAGLFEKTNVKNQIKCSSTSNTYGPQLPTNMVKKYISHEGYKYLTIEMTGKDNEKIHVVPSNFEFNILKYEQDIPENSRINSMQKFIQTALCSENSAMKGSMKGRRMLMYLHNGLLYQESQIYDRYDLLLSPVGSPVNVFSDSSSCGDTASEDEVYKYPTDRGEKRKIIPPDRLSSKPIQQTPPTKYRADAAFVEKDKAFVIQQYHAFFELKGYNN